MKTGREREAGEETGEFQEGGKRGRNAKRVSFSIY